LYNFIVCPASLKINFIWRYWKVHLNT